MVTARRSRAVVVLGLAGSLALAACSSGGEGASTTAAGDAVEVGSALGSSPAGTLPPGVVLAEEEAVQTTDAGDAAASDRAASSLLTLDDFAKGWQKISTTGSAVIADCFTASTYSIAIARAGTDVGYGVFSSTDRRSQTVLVSAAVFPTEEDAAAVITDAASEPFATCLEGRVLDLWANEGTATSSVDFVDAPLSTSAESVQLQSSFDLDNGDGTTTAVSVGVAFLRTEDLVTTVALVDTGGLGFADTLPELIGGVDARHGSL